MGEACSCLSDMISHFSPFCGSGSRGDKQTRRAHSGSVLRHTNSKRVAKDSWCPWMKRLAVPPPGLEPGAYGLGNRRSIHLSYEGVRNYGTASTIFYRVDLGRIPQDNLVRQAGITLRCDD